MPKFMVGADTSLLGNQWENRGIAIAPEEVQKHSSFNPKPIAQAKAQAWSQKNHYLLLQEHQTAKNIAAQLGVTISHEPIPTDINLLQINGQLIWLNRAIYISIVNKLGAVMPNPGPICGDLVTQNHLLLLGNRRILWAIAQTLKIALPPLPQLCGIMAEQNYQMLLGNLCALEVIAVKVDAIAIVL